MSDRDKFLTEAMGGCWHEAAHPLYVCRCLNGCGTILNQPAWKPINTDFSIWEGFGKLWEWSKDQKWFCLMMAHNGCGPHDIVNPDLFANEVYKFLTKEADKP